MRKSSFFGKWVLSFETLNSTFYVNEDIFDKKFKSSGVKRSMGAFWKK